MEMNAFPIPMNAPPIPLTKEYLIALAQIVSKADLAAKQKFFPVRAIFFYFFKTI
jgi:hypothetical protein